MNGREAGQGGIGVAGQQPSSVRTIMAARYTLDFVFLWHVLWTYRQTYLYYFKTLKYIKFLLTRRCLGEHTAHVYFDVI